MPVDPKPSIFERALAAVAPTYALQRAIAREKLTLFGYDAANPGVKRGSSGGMAKNASSETPRMAMDRLKLIWEARDLERNMPVIRGVLDRVAQYVCSQVLYQSQSGDPAWDSLAEAYLEKWFTRDADITGRTNFRTLVEVGFRSMLRDGDFGFYLVRNGARLQLQCIEADRIGDPNTVANQQEDDYVQGIRLNSLGQPVSYDIFKRDRKSSRYEFEATADAKNFFLLRKPLRSDEYRGTSWLAPVVAQARDLYEMFSFERGAAKWAASIAGVIRVTDPLAKSGAGSAGMWDGVSRDANGNPTEKVEGNKLLRLRPNEDITPFNTGNRPSGAFMAYIEAALKDIAFGLNLPYGFFDMSKFGGATIRLEAQQLQRMFARFQEILVTSLLDGVKRAVLANAIAVGELPPNKNFDWGRWQFGKALTADTGYDTDANLALLQAGLKSASEIAGEEGYDYEDLTDQLIKEVVILRNKCAAAGVPVEMVAMGRFPDASNQLAAAQEALDPAPTSTISDLGEGATKTLVDILEKVASGQLPREEAVATLVGVFELDPVIAETIVPTPQPVAVAANLPGTKSPVDAPPGNT
ncbi:bacteriophage capsid protein [Opitutaceae bacterium TAV1]|nr:bacteriophage capsid protein [Opitutaceae bacterium TAV1]